MTTGRTIGWAVGGLLAGVLAGFGAELLRRQPAAKVQHRYVAPPSSPTTEAAPPAPEPEPPRPEPGERTDRYAAPTLAPGAGTS
ncbi:MAG TPA: hypothetical protein VGJ44_16010 [Kribbellaceae bacterium]|jgi:hypothetical protein